jgi:hypothetical protein
MKTNPLSILCLTTTASLFFLAPSAPAAALQTLRGHVPAAVAQLRPTGRLPATNRLHLAVALAPRNRDALEKLLRDLQDPHSPSYHQYLSLEEFTSRFSPTEKDYQKAMDFARANGLKVSGTYSNRIILDMEGAVTDVEKALHVTIRTYQHPTEKREFYAPDTEPSLDLAVPLLNITGLDNYSLPHRTSHRKPVQPAVNAGTANGVKANGPTPSAASGTNGYVPADLRKAYVPGTTLTGAGQSVGLLELTDDTSAPFTGGYYDSDLLGYESEFGLPHISVTTVPVDGGLVTATNNAQRECTLDIEMVMAMAPGASIYVFESPGYPNDVLSAMVNYTFIKQFSTSWNGLAGGFHVVGGSPNPGGDVLLMEMAAQGQSFFAASGDFDAYVNQGNFFNPPYWEQETTYATVVGGTVLTMNGSGVSYASETVWNPSPGAPGFQHGSGGGLSLNYAMPYWQQGVSMTANHGSTTVRNSPDVAMAAFGLDVYVDGADNGLGDGTSASAPLWAGFMALVNQQAASLGNPSAGFINPAIYALGQGTGNTPYASAFHDITTGNNFWQYSPNNYPAVAGYDLCTGWGTPAVGLINALAGPYQSVVLNTNDNGPGSLRQAISNVIAGAYAFSVITFATNLSGATIHSSGTMTLTGNLTIDASALPRGITINGNQAGSVFFATNGNVVLTALTITNGNASASGVGGGILNYAVLKLNQCTLAGNSAGYAGGIANAYGTLLVNESTLTGNSGSYGGGILNLEGALTVNQSTLTGNSDASGAAGGMYNWDELGSITLYNSIVAGNSLPNTSGYNSQTSTTTSGITTQTGANLTNGTPLLAPLGNYGGPTPTMPPLPGSPAIDGCTNGTTFTTDQRGYPRSAGLAPDIGAVEGVYNSAGPGTLKNVTRLGNGSVSFTLTNYSDMLFTVLASTNLALPLSQWSNLGTAVESPLGSGQYPFTDLQATNYSRRFYKATSP